MDILMVLGDNDYPPDIRVDKEVSALQEAGHHITLLCDSHKGRPRRENLGIEVVRLPPLTGLPYRLNRRAFYMDFIDWHWFTAIYRLLRQKHSAAIHVHDLPLARTAWLVSKLCRIPLVLDLHENWPVLVHILAVANHREQLRRVYGLEKWQAYERWAIAKADFVIAVIEESRERLIGEGGDGDKIVVVRNTTDVEQFISLAKPVQDLPLPESGFIITYAGGFGPHRGVDVAIKAMPIVLKSVPNAHLVLAGKGGSTVGGETEMKALVRDLGIESHVTFTGWLEFDKTVGIIKKSHVGLVPHQRNPHCDTTIPHKLFQFMAFSKPLVVSDVPPLKRIVQSADCGLVFQAADAAELATCIVRLADESLAKAMGQRGYRGAMTQFSWRVDSERLCGLYDKIALSITR